MTSWSSVRRFSWAYLVPGETFCSVLSSVSTQHTKLPRSVKAPAMRDLPLIGFVHPAHFLAQRLQKQLKQYANSSLEVKRCPDNCFLHPVHTKHSLCHGCSRQVTPPVVIACFRKKKRQESVFLRVAGSYFDLVKRKGDEILVGGRRGRRLNYSKIIILLGIDLEKIMPVLYCNFLIYKKTPHTKSTLFCIYCKISISVVLCFSSYSLCVAFYMHVLEFVSSLYLHLSLSSWWRDYLTCFNFTVTFFGKDQFISYWSIYFLLLQTLSGSFLLQVTRTEIISSLKIS